MTAGQKIPNWLAHRAGVLAAEPALIADSTTWSFAALDRWACSIARRLATLGVAPGDRVALLLRNSPEFVALIHAAPRLGAVLAPLNIRLVAPELAWQIADAGAHVLVYDAGTAELAVS